MLRPDCYVAGLQQRKEGVYDEETALQLSQILAVNPDFYTLWNYRRQIFLHWKAERYECISQSALRSSLWMLLATLSECIRSWKWTNYVWYSSISVMSVFRDEANWDVTDICFIPGVANTCRRCSSLTCNLLNSASEWTQNPTAPGTTGNRSPALSGPQIIPDNAGHNRLPLETMWSRRVGSDILKGLSSVSMLDYRRVHLFVSNDVLVALRAVSASQKQVRRISRRSLA